MQSIRAMSGRVQRALITHITDIEGNGDKFSKIIAASTDLCFKEEINSPKKASLSFNADASPHSQFVYGGDVGDKGQFSLGLIHALVDFKQREPERVHLIVGNREAKMTRIMDELPEDASGVARLRLLSSPPVFWNKSTPPIAFVESMLKKSGSKLLPAEYVSSLSDKECEMVYLKWMLAETMGCGAVKHNGMLDTFSLYHQEIQSQNVSDSSGEYEVLQYLRQQLKPSGSYFDYLSKGVLMHRIGDTLFVHGAITPANLGFVPDKTHPVHNVDDWMNELNGWYAQEISNWSKGKQRLRSETEAPGGSKLMWYLVANPRSVVTTNWYNSARQIAPLSDEVIDYLSRGGIQRVVTGHQPFSDFPLVIRHPSGFHVINGDTSFSDDSHPSNNQGIAYHTLEIQDKDDGICGEYKNTVGVINSVRRNGNRHIINLSDPAYRDVGVVNDKGVRRINETGEWVVSQLKGFDVLDTPL